MINIIEMTWYSTGINSIMFINNFFQLFDLLGPKRNNRLNSKANNETTAVASDTVLKTCCLTLLMSLVTNELQQAVFPVV